MYIKFSSVSTIQSNALIHISTIDFCLINLHICLFYACETFFALYTQHINNQYIRASFVFTYTFPYYRYRCNKMVLAHLLIPEIPGLSTVI